MDYARKQRHSDRYLGQEGEDGGPLTVFYTEPDSFVR